MLIAKITTKENYRGLNDLFWRYFKVVDCFQCPETGKVKRWSCRIWCRELHCYITADFLPSEVETFQFITKREAAQREAEHMGKFLIHHSTSRKTSGKKRRKVEVMK
jgi:hypothetical protein